MTDRPNAGRFAGREHRLPVRVYYEDTDFTGVVYHGAYVRFFERGRSDALRLAGVHHSELQALPEPAAFAVVRMEIDFRRAARVDDALLVRSTFEAFRGPRLTGRQRIFRAEELVAEALVEVAVIGAGGRPRRPPPVLVEALRPLVGPRS